LLPAPCVTHTEIGLAVSLALWRLAASLLYVINATDRVTSSAWRYCYCWWRSWQRSCPRAEHRGLIRWMR